MTKALALCIAIIVAAQSSASKAQDSYNLSVGSRAEAPHVEDVIDRKRVEGRYGKKPGQTFTFYAAKRRQPSPLAVFLTANSSIDTARFAQTLLDDGISVVYLKLGYESKGTVRTEASQYAQAIAYLRSNSQRFPLSPEFALIGFWYEGGTAALIGTDPSILESVAVSFADLKGVVGIDMVGSDGSVVVASTIRNRSLIQFYGNDKTDQMASTAIGHLASPNAPAFYFADQKEIQRWSPREGATFAKLLNQNGTSAEAAAIPEQVDVGATKFGAANNPHSGKILRFIETSLKQGTGRPTE